MSTVKIEPEACAVVSEARTAVSVNATGSLNVTFAVPVVSAVVSSLAANCISIGCFLFSQTNDYELYCKISLFANVPEFIETLCNSSNS